MEEQRQNQYNIQDEIVRAISCGVIAYTIPDYELLSVNEAAKAMIGCGADEDPIAALRRFLMEYVLDEDKKAVHAAKNDLTHTGDFIALDYRARIGGRTVYLHATLKLLELGDGRPYILVTLLDNTEQVHLNNSLNRERLAYREALDNGSEYSFFFDLTAGMLTEEIVTAHGIHIMDILGLPLPVAFDEMTEKYLAFAKLQFTDPDMAKYYTRAGLLEAFAEGHTNVMTEYYSPLTDVYTRTSSLMYRDEKDGHIHVAVVASDMTEVRKKEREQQLALQRSNEKLAMANDEMNKRLDTILDGISGGLKIADVEDGYRYVFISEGAAALQGYTVEEFLANFGHRVTSNICEGEGEPALEEANRQILEQGQYAVKYRVPHKNGSIRWVIDRGKLITDQLSGRKYLYILMQDVTELEDRNTELAKAVDMQCQMADSLGTGIFCYTIPEYEVLTLNREARRLFHCMGSDRSRFGMDIVSKIVPEDLATVRAAEVQLKEPGDHADYVFHSIGVGGSRVTVKCTTKLLAFPDGQKYILSAMTDITQQEQMERRIDEERRQYRNALVHGSEGYFTLDITEGLVRDRVILGTGECLSDMLGLTLPVQYDALAELWFSPQRISAISGGVGTLRSRKALMQACEDGRSVIESDYCITKTGKYYHLLTLPYRFGERYLVTFIAYDVTANRKEAQQRRAVIDSLGRIYSSLYHLSLKDMTCTVVKRAEQVSRDLDTYCSYAEFYALYTGKYAEEEYRDALCAFLEPAHIRAALADSDYTSMEFKRTGLGWCRVTLVAAERDAGGDVISVVFAGNIIEEQKQAELAQQEALKAAVQAANFANSAKTEFLANMSHDIRTPMNAIIGMTAIAGTHLDDRERLKDCLSKISVSSKHLLGIINEVLDMSKIESGKLDLQEEEFHLPDLIDNLLTMSKPTIAAKNHQLSVSIHGIEHERVIGDSQRIQQVFMNLMSNAIKYTPQGGSIWLSITEKPTNRQQIGCYEFVFEDNGIGMSASFLEHIFEPFTRARADRRVDQIQGAGLGMPITRNIIQLMNGDIEVESELNKGTKVTVTFSLKLQTEDNQIAYEKLIDLPVLVADDDEISCIYTCDMLHEIGMKGEWVLSGEDAVAKTVAHHRAGDDFFAIILDWKMPGMDGVATTKEIRRQVGKTVPIIIVSAYDWSDIELEARAAGADAFISKPLFKSRMLHMFNELVGGTTEEKDGSLDAFSQHDFTGKRALLVEDNALNAEIAGEILGMAGLEVEYATDGKEAVDRLSTVADGYYDVVFMDIQMPIMNGYEAARAIRALPGNYAKSVPILAMTANAFAEDVAAAKNAGMNEHIAKPLDFNQLETALAKWLG